MKVGLLSCMRGAFYVEALVAVAILAIALVPASNAIHAGLQSSARLADTTLEHFSLLTRMEELLAERFNSLESAALAAGSPSVTTTYSDSPGTPRRLVNLAHYDIDDADADADPFTGTEADVLWLRVEIEGTNRGLDSLVTR